MGSPHPSDEPFVDRILDVRLRGDWGGANIHTICGWLSQELWDRCGAGSRISIWSGRGTADAVTAVMNGEADLAVATPSEFASMAYRGVGLHQGSAQARLRALGRLPQNDRIVIALDSRLGISNFAQLRAAKPALRLVTARQDAESWMGFAARKVLELSGIAFAEFENWGARFVEIERGAQAVPLMASGEGDAIIYEAISSPLWQHLNDKLPLQFIEVEEDAISRARSELGWTSGRLPNARFPVHDDFRTLDFSDFTILVRDDFPDDLADLVAWILISTRANLERKFRHYPGEFSPVGYPIIPDKIIDTLVPLHPAAALRYAKMGLDTPSSA